MQTDLFRFFCNDTATNEIYTLSLHDALPIYDEPTSAVPTCLTPFWTAPKDRKSTRLNSSHVKISYAVFCLKKKRKTDRDRCIKKKKKIKEQIRIEKVKE